MAAGVGIAVATAVWLLPGNGDGGNGGAGGKVGPAPPLADDPGEWTVVYHHATSDKNHRSVVCHGFMADTVSE
ncbi:hypothetical protein ACWFRQ_19885 [Streptomyces niveus]